MWAHVDHRDGTGEKLRPAVVIDVRGREVVVLPVTTSARRHRLRDHVEVHDLDEAGLDRPSAICTRSCSVDRIDLTSICGALSEQDHRRLAETCSLGSTHEADVAA